VTRRSTSRGRPGRGALGSAVATLVIAGCGGSHAAGGPAAGREGAVGTVGPRFQASGWHTDFARHTVPLSTIAPGGPSRDGIPPVDHPRFTTLAEAARFLTGREPVIALVIAGRARAYPLQILLWHEIVNDVVAGTPVAVTYCPLCNTAIVFARRLGTRSLSLGTTGDLRNSDLVMWDRQTQSWWQQYDGSAIVGVLAGAKLTVLPSATVSFAAFRARYPHGTVLSRRTGFDRPYGRNPYVGYDERGRRPFLYEGRLDPRLPPLERVKTIDAAGETAVLPFASLRVHPVTTLTIGAAPAVVLFDRDVSSPLEALSTRESRAVGSAQAFDRRLDGRTLSFSALAPGTFTDAQTGSRWDITGHASSGPLRGAQLHRLHDLQAFWFALAAFVPDARLVRP
jgi:Protein of unknown function (DUF3179)